MQPHRLCKLEFNIKIPHNAIITSVLYPARCHSYVMYLGDVNIDYRRSLKESVSSGVYIICIIILWHLFLFRYVVISLYLWIRITDYHLYNFIPCTFNKFGASDVNLKTGSVWKHFCEKNIFQYFTPKSARSGCFSSI